ncbi:MAG: putative membrane protein YfcA [Patiriisocius sp.]
MITRIYKLFKLFPVKIGIIAVWIVLLGATQSYLLVVDYGGFLFLGVVGAIFANATGAGGGVVFVPFFNQLSLSSETIVATSFAIQCCGMTAGAITWFNHYRSLKQTSHKDHAQSPQWQSLGKGLAICVPFSIGGILTAQYVLYEYTSYIQSGLHLYFGLFSIVLAIAIYASIPFMRRQQYVSAIVGFDVIMLTLIAFWGGVITAWLSVGVGELVAVYLILRRFNISFAIALAVILSAFTVQGAIIYHLLISKAVYWQIVIFAGAGAIIGGIIAKHVVLYFSPVKLKIFFATWVLVMGLAGLPIWMQ